jgi:hypothetical protein
MHEFICPAPSAKNITGYLTQHFIVLGCVIVILTLGPKEVISPRYRKVT